MSYTKSFTKGAYLRYASFFLIGLLALGIQKVLTDYFSTETYGVYCVFFSILNFCVQFFSVWLQFVITRFVPQYMANKEYANLRHLYRTTALAVFFLALIPFLIVTLAGSSIGHTLNLPELSGRLYFTVGLLIIFGNMIVFNNGVLTGFASYGIHTASELSSSTVRLILIALCGLFAPRLDILFLGIALAYFFHLTFTFLGVRYNFKHLPEAEVPPAVDYKEIGLYSFSRFFHTATAGILDYSFDIYMITWLLGTQGPEQAGLYGLGASMIKAAVNLNPGHICIDVIRTTVLMKHDSTKDFDFVLWITRLYIKMVAFFYLPLIVGVAFLGHSFIGLFFKPEYLQSAPIFIIGVACMATAVTFMEPFYMVADVLKLKRIFIYERLFLIYNVALNFILIPKIGILGAILSTGTTWLFMALFNYFYIRMRTKVQVDWPALLKMIVNILPMAAFFYLVRSHITTFAAFVGAILAGLGTYMACSYYNKILSADERELLNNALKRKLIFF